MKSLVDTAAKMPPKSEPRAVRKRNGLDLPAPPPPPGFAG
jgi:hypothetical protein